MGRGCVAVAAMKGSRCCLPLICNKRLSWGKKLKGERERNELQEYPAPKRKSHRSRVSVWACPPPLPSFLPSSSPALVLLKRLLPGGGLLRCSLVEEGEKLWPAPRTRPAAGPKSGPCLTPGPRALTPAHSHTHTHTHTPTHAHTPEVPEQRRAR